MAITNKDIDKLKEVFATKQDLNTMKDELVKKIDDRIKEEVVGRLDRILGEQEKSREDRTLAIGKDRDQDRQIADLEKRMDVVEEKVGIV